MIPTGLLLAAALASSAAASPAGFTGAAACLECHPREAAAWRGSHHDLAMQPATDSTVLGDFHATPFETGGERTRFDDREGRYAVTTPGPEGNEAEFEIGWTFGVDPLQQYLIQLPDGRLQALGVAWDARPAADGGQRWIHLYPDDPPRAGEELHWTGMAQNWNYMCADCHVTGYRRNYDARADRFDPAFSDPDVACEACHGPGAAHVSAAREGRSGAMPMDLSRSGRRWVREQGAATASLAAGATPTPEVEACARCHSRRAPLVAEYLHGRPLMDSYLPALIESPLYFPDGQIQDEVYVWGSFRMSRMHAAGVVCSDCHEPHGLSLRAEGNGVCGQCHAPAVFDSASHHRHEAGNPGSACVDCHMPARTYMVVDPRRDHGFRVPRPDLADSLDVPDACRSCHADRPAGWTAARVREWLGRDAAGSQRFAETLHAADTWAPDAPGALRALAADEGQPAIARASALARLSRWPGRATEAAARDGLAHADALLRLGAVRAVASAPGDGGRRLLSGALGDPVKAVRLEAAVALSRAGLAALDPALRSRLAPVLEEYVALQEAFLDRPEARTNLGNLYAAAGEPAVAERRYREALSLQRDFEAAWVNLADLYRAQGRQSEAREVLERAAAIVPASAAVQHSLGLAAVRAGERGLALERLERAVELDPANGRYAWVYAVALDDAGRGGEAVATLEEALARRPADPQLLEGMVSLLMKAGRHGDALVHARRLATLRPDDAQLAALLRELSRD